MYAVPLCVFILHMWEGVLYEGLCRCSGVYGAEVCRGLGCRCVRCTVVRVHLEQVGNMMCEVVSRCRGVYGAEVCRGAGCRCIRCTDVQVGNMMYEVVCKCDEGVEV